MTRQRRSIAIVGSGMAGATLAQALARQGHAVHVFDKARGPGGRMATRRLEWVDHQGRAAVTHLDHGALGFAASDLGFLAFVSQGLRAGVLAPWTLSLAPTSLPLEGDSSFYVATPQMPSWCRHLLDGVPVSLSFAVDALHRGPSGWRVQAGALRHDAGFDAVLLALPPAQAAPLLQPYRPEWAQLSSAARMQPCWTLMGVAGEARAGTVWGLGRPPAGPLAWVMRNDTRPGRSSVPGQAHWVAHARTDWSHEHLEQPAEWVRQQMQAALAEFFGRPIEWQHSTVHRWRYALPLLQGSRPAASCWWDGSLGIGVCGDFLGGDGVEGAWLSAQALSQAVLDAAPMAAGSDDAQGLAEAGSPTTSTDTSAARGAHSLLS